jgi:short subunit dehydrogenase-like uncharacterized protein
MADDEASDKRWLLYGANGYTGELIAEVAAERGEKPILAGRSASKIEPMGERLGLETRVFSLDEPQAVAEGLRGVSAVLHCAGPFSVTSAPMVDGCIATKTHYLDITGEISVFEACHMRTEEAAEAGVTLMPGVGFDVVPTDCLAASLAEALPDAKRLLLAFTSLGSSSQGTAKTAVESLSDGGAIRKNGWIERVPTAYRTRTIPFHDKPRVAMTIPWGDVSTAYYSTGIGDIEVYMAVPQRAILAAKMSRPLTPIFGLSAVKNALESRIERGARGPNAEERARSRSEIWGRVETAGGRGIEATLTTPGGYTLTTATALESTLRAVRGETKPGALTPSMAFGSRFIEEFEGCVLRLGDG